MGRTCPYTVPDSAPLERESSSSTRLAYTSATRPAGEGRAANAPDREILRARSTTSRLVIQCPHGLLSSRCLPSARKWTRELCSLVPTALPRPARTSQSHTPRPRPTEASVRPSGEKATED